MGKVKSKKQKADYLIEQHKLCVRHEKQLLTRLGLAKVYDHESKMSGLRRAYLTTSMVKQNRRLSASALAPTMLILLHSKLKHKNTFYINIYTNSNTNTNSTTNLLSQINNLDDKAVNHKSYSEPELDRVTYSSRLNFTHLGRASASIRATSLPQLFQAKLRQTNTHQAFNAYQHLKQATFFNRSRLIRSVQLVRCLQ